MKPNYLQKNGQFFERLCLSLIYFPRIGIPYLCHVTTNDRLDWGSDSKIGIIAFANLVSKAGEILIRIWKWFCFDDFGSFLWEIKMQIQNDKQDFCMVMLFQWFLLDDKESWIGWVSHIATQLQPGHVILILQECYTSLRPLVHLQQSTHKKII